MSMGKYNTQDICKALTIIKEVCDFNSLCHTCPFYDPSSEECRFGASYTDRYPSSWKINNGDPTWRALF